MDTKYFKMDFSVKKITSFIPLLSSLKTVQYLLSFETFNDSMYSTNMVSSDCSP